MVINDSLGLAEQLEQEMQIVIDNYACEWKVTIENPEKLKRFRTFINSDQPDDTIVLVEEREQVRPATAEEKQQLANAS